MARFLFLAVALTIAAMLSSDGPGRAGATGEYFMTIGVGDEYGCRASALGEIVCWGRNDFHQSDPPAGVLQTAWLSAGDVSACGVNNYSPSPSYRQLICWGDKPFASSEPSGTFLQVRAGEAHACALRTDRTVDCWGEEDGSGRTADPAGTYQSVSAGATHSCGIKFDDLTLTCWGTGVPATMAGTFDGLASNGNSVCAFRAPGPGGGSIVCMGDISSPGDPGPFNRMSLSANGACALRGNGQMYCWGGATAQPGSYQEVSLGASFMCALATTGGQVTCWGDDTYGQITADRDSDGIYDYTDNCVSASNANQANYDGDSQGDVCDSCPHHSGLAVTDTDGDGVPNLCDNCVSVQNPDQANPDADFFGNSCDNCPTVANNNQRNLVHPATPAGDACDDPDGDGDADIADNCPDDSNSNQSNVDGDVPGDACEPAHCVAVPNWWTSPGAADDPDCDGFTTEIESDPDIGTDPNDSCANTATTNDENPDDKWPVDFNDNRFVNTLDLTGYAMRLNTVPVTALDRRHDLNQNDVINSLDLTPYATMMGRTCVPPP